MRKTKADENPSSLSLQVAITQKNTKITRLCVIHTWKNTKITRFPRFLGKFRTCMRKWLKPGILSSTHECRVRGYCIPTSLNVILLVLAHTLLYCWLTLIESMNNLVDNLGARLSQPCEQGCDNVVDSLSGPRN